MTITIIHPMLAAVDANAIAQAALEGDVETIELKLDEAIREVGRTEEWSEAKRELVAVFETQVRPALDRHDGGQLHYFGTACIPLTMQLGYLVGSWPRVVVHQRHHTKRTWDWEAPRPTLRSLELPDSLVRAEGDVVIRIAVSTEVDREDIEDLVPGPLAEIDIALERPAPDALSAEHVDLVTDAFARALQAIQECRPRTRMIHVFASVPTGVAFALGTRISNTMTASVQTYFYDAKKRPRHRPAFVIQDNIEPAQPTLTAEQRGQADDLRRSWAEQHRRLVEFAAALRDRRQEGHDWLRTTLMGHDDTSMFAGAWRELPALDGATLGENVDVAQATAPGGAFFFDEAKRTWRFDEHLLHGIISTMPDEAQREQAGRMLILHEALHGGKHQLTGPTSREIGRFAKVLEEIDYQADVWTMITEYAFVRHHHRTKTDDARAFFLSMVDTAIQTFWAFDASAGPTTTIQVRRMNRYLIWCWQYLRLEQADGLVDALTVLATKPVIEVAGARVEARGERVWVNLDPRGFGRLEVGVWRGNALGRYGDGHATDVKALLAGFRQRDGEKILNELRGVFDLVGR